METKFKSGLLFIKMILFKPSLLINSRYDTPLENFRFPRAAQIYREDNEVIRRLSIKDIFKFLGIPEPKDVVLSFLNEGKNQSLNPYEIEIICKIAKSKNPLNYLEIGTFEGRTSANIAQNTSEKCRIFTINLPPTKKSFEIGRFIEKSPFKYKIKQILCDSKQVNYSDLPNFDMIFIDGDHSYEGVTIDTKNALTKLKDDGIIIWDDVDNCHLGVTEAVTEQAEEYNLKLAWIAGTKMVVGIKNWV